jgi:hypothetical protein
MKLGKANFLSQFLTVSFVAAVVFEFDVEIEGDI